MKLKTWGRRMEKEGKEPLESPTELSLQVDGERWEVVVGRLVARRGLLDDDLEGLGREEDVWDDH